MTWSQSFTGREIDYLNPDPNNIVIDDIAVQISREGRWANCTRFKYSVGQHSLHVMQIVQELSPGDVAAQLWALCHDFHEAYIRDMATPFQTAVVHAVVELTGVYNADPIAVIKDRLDRAIAKAFRIEWHDIEASLPLVKQADKIALSTEAYQLMEPHDWKKRLVEPDTVDLHPNEPGNVEFLIRRNFDRLLSAYHASRTRAPRHTVTAHHEDIRA